MNQPQPPQQPGEPAWYPPPGATTPYEPYPAGHGGYPGAPMFPVRMPLTVRLAQIGAVLGGVLGVVVIAAVVVTSGDVEMLTKVIVGFTVQIALGGCALGFGSGGKGLRTTAIVLASLQGLCGFGGIGAQQPPGLVGLLIGLGVVILLARRSAGAWFERPRLLGDHPAA